MTHLILTTVTAITEGAITSGAIETGSGLGLIEFFESLGGLKNFLVSISGVSLLAVLYKVNGLVKIIKSPSFETILLDTFEKFAGRLTDNPDLATKTLALLTSLPVVKNWFDKADTAKAEILLELEGRLIDIETKIKSGLFSGDELQKMLEYKAKLLEHLETNQ